MGRTRLQGCISEDSLLFFATVIHNILRWKSTPLCHLPHRSFVVLTSLFREQGCGSEGDDGKIPLYFSDFSLYFYLMFFQTDGLCLIQISHFIAFDINIFLLHTSLSF